MAGENENKTADNTGQENSIGTNPTNGNTPSGVSSDPAIDPAKDTVSGSGSSQPAFKEPVILDAVVNPNTPQKEGATPFSFTSPKAMQQKMAEPTKGDATTAATDPKKPTLEQLDAQIARDEKAGKELTYDDYLDSATMFVDAWESALIMICRAISKDSSDAAYGFPVATREKLIRHGVKVSRKRGWVVPIELLAGGTLMAATTNIVMKARDKKKESEKNNKGAPMEKEVVKGGPEKGNTKRRGPGRPGM